MIRSKVAPVALLLVGGFVLAGCAAGPNNVARVNAPHIAGFWLGLWHGIILPITFVISLFNHQLNVYDVHNNGNWYNFGFVLGASIVFGSGSRAGYRKR